MWSNFDFTDLSKLGSQLGEVIQKAKDEVDRSLDKAFQFDNDVTVGGDGLLITVDNTKSKEQVRPHTTQEQATASQQAPAQKEAPLASSTTPAQPPKDAVANQQPQHAAVSPETTASSSAHTAVQKPARSPSSKSGIGTSKAPRSPLQAAPIKTTDPHTSPHFQQQQQHALDSTQLLHDRRWVDQPHQGASSLSYQDSTEQRPSTPTAASSKHDDAEHTLAKASSTNGTADAHAASLLSHAGSLQQLSDGVTLANGEQAGPAAAVLALPSSKQQSSVAAQSSDAAHSSDAADSPSLDAAVLQHDSAAGTLVSRDTGSSTAHNNKQQPQQQQQQQSAADPSTSTADHVQEPVGAATAATAAADTLHQLPGDSSTSGLSNDELQQLVANLQSQLVAREQQMVRQAGQLCDLEATVEQLSEAKQQLQAVLEQLTQRNEQLALKAVKVSEEDLESLRSEFEQRLAAAERKCFQLQKEKDALRKTASKSADMDAIIKEKDDLAKQLMEEGEKLSKRQLELEGTIKKLRASLRDEQADKDKLTAQLAAEQAECESLRKGKAKADKDLATAVEASKHEIDSLRQEHEARLMQAKADLAAAEERARSSAKEGLSRRLQQSEARCGALAETVAELREALERQRQVADGKEESLKQELHDFQHRAQTAETLHQELTARLPEATRPLLRQIESMQAAALAQQDAWATAERALQVRIADAESRAAAAEERAQLSADRAKTLQDRLAAVESASHSSNTELQEARQAVARGEEQAKVMEDKWRQSEAQVQRLQAVVENLQSDMKQAEQRAQERVRAERSSRIAAEQELARVRQEGDQKLAQHIPTSADMHRAAEPPAMAGPGYRWVLIREGEDVPASQMGGIYGTNAGGLLGESVPDSPASSIRSGSRRLTAADSMKGLIDGFGEGWDSAISRQGSTPPASAYDGVGTGVASSNSNLGLHGGGHGHRGGGASEANIERLRAALRQKLGEAAGLEARVRELEATRDTLAEELLIATKQLEQASNAISELDRLKAANSELSECYYAAVELVGERDESLEELRADLADVKELYRQQLEHLLGQLDAARQQQQQQGHG